eukprot:7103827-Prorocentrum_lima.AAC.1
MTSSLVGSEMCIRDSENPDDITINVRASVRNVHVIQLAQAPSGHLFIPVSYTHLTLPTICSV